MLGEFKHTDQPDYSEEGERRAGLGAGAAHRRQYVEESHVIRYDRRQINDVLEITPEQKLRWTRNKPDDYLQRKPSRTVQLITGPNASEYDDVSPRRTE